MILRRLVPRALLSSSVVDRQRSTLLFSAQGRRLHHHHYHRPKAPPLPSSSLHTPSSWKASFGRERGGASVRLQPFVPHWRQREFPGEAFFLSIILSVVRCSALAAAAAMSQSLCTYKLFWPGSVCSGESVSDRRCNHPRFCCEHNEQAGPQTRTAFRGIREGATIPRTSQIALQFAEQPVVTFNRLSCGTP